MRVLAIREKSRLKVKRSDTAHFDGGIVLVRPHKVKNVWQRDRAESSGEYGVEKDNAGGRRLSNMETGMKRFQKR